MPRPPPPATALISTGKADLVGEAAAPRRSSSMMPSLPGTTGTLAFAGQLAGRVLVAQLGHRLGRGADEVDVAAAADFVEVGVLGQEAVARDESPARCRLRRR